MTELASILANLAKDRDELLAAQKKDFKVPGWGENGKPAFWIVYKPAGVEDQRQVIERLEKVKSSKLSEAALEANAGVLVKNTLAVAIGVDGERVCVGEPGTLDSPYDWFQLNEYLKLKDERAIAICRALFLKEGELMQQARALAEWSGLVSKNVDEEFSGE